MSADHLTRLAVFPEACAAHSLRILLEACGIRAFVTGDHLFTDAIGAVPSGLVGVEVLVRQGDLAMAKKVMHEVPAAAEILIPAWICECGADVDQGFSVCWSCGHELEPEVDGEP